MSEAQTAPLPEDWSSVVNADIGHIFVDRIEEGLRFIVLRGPASLCAYIGIAKDHPLAGHDCDDLALDCHGGLTYGGAKLQGMPPGYWWYGWDYAHCDDRSTYDSSLARSGEQKEWTPKLVDEDSWSARYAFKKLARLAERIRNNATTASPART